MKQRYRAQGVPSAILAALREYDRRCRDLDRIGIGAGARDEIILAECADAMHAMDAMNAVGGDVAPAPLDLTAWAERYEVPRRVLEAVVLELWAREREATPPVVPLPTPPPPPSAATEPAASPPLSSAPLPSEPTTPAPRAQRPGRPRSLKLP